MNLDLGDTRLIIAKTVGLPLKHRAYILATAYHETAHTMKPVREYGGETYLKTKKYYPYVGMGYVQLTWDYNYKKASKKLGVDFMNSPSLLLKPEYAVVILITGMIEGWFTGKKLSDYNSYVDMRRIVNGTDKAKLIASYAEEYEDDLIRLEATDVKPVVEPEVKPVVVDTQKPVEKVSTSVGTSLLNVLIMLLKKLLGVK